MRQPAHQLDMIAMYKRDNSTPAPSELDKNTDGKTELVEGQPSPPPRGRLFPVASSESVLASGCLADSFLNVVPGSLRSFLQGELHPLPKCI